MNRITLITSLLVLFVLIAGVTPVFGDSNTEHVKGVTAITEVFGDGQKVSAVALQYDMTIDNSKLSDSAFSVEGRNITKIYTNSVGSKASTPSNGEYVIIELSPDDVHLSAFGTNTGVSSGNAGTTQGPGPNNSTQSTQTGTMGPPPTGFGQSSTQEPLTVSVTQTGNVVTTDGMTYAPSSQVMVNDNVINLVVDDFLQLNYTAPQTGKTLMYNLFVPKDCDPSKSYPMVLFMPDASATSTQHDKTLTQGLGAVIWATPSEQAKHECLVLAPQYSTELVNDTNTISENINMTYDLVQYIADRYSIDRNRIYTTGQSGGCMASIALDILHPDLFAGSLLVAGQWDPTQVAPLADQNIWIVVSEGDAKAFPGMNNITAALEHEGAKVSRATWSGLSTPEEFASDVSKMEAENTNIKYTVLQKGTVVPSYENDDAGSNHINTWRIAYTIEGLRDWLFSQVKKS